MFRIFTNATAKILTSLLLLAGFAAIPAEASQQKDVPQGSVVWFDLLTEDADRVMDFYRGIFGWELRLQEPGAWVVLHNGQPIAGISEIEDLEADAVESFWLAGIAVDDIAGAVSRARKLGATVHQDVNELAGFARYAIIEDPQTAPLMLATPLIVAPPPVIHIPDFPVAVPF